MRNIIQFYYQEVSLSKTKMLSLCKNEQLKMKIQTNRDDLSTDKIRSLVIRSLGLRKVLVLSTCQFAKVSTLGRKKVLTLKRKKEKNMRTEIQKLRLVIWLSMVTRY